MGYHTKAKTQPSIMLTIIMPNITQLRTARYFYNLPDRASIMDHRVTYQWLDDFCDHESDTTYSGSTFIALPPNLLWHIPHILPSVISTLRFRPKCPAGCPSPRRSLASSLASITFWSPAKIRLSLTTVLAALIRAVKYNSNFWTGRTSGIRLRVDEAGNRDPCFANMLSAGPHCGSRGDGGER